MSKCGIVNSELFMVSHSLQSHQLKNWFIMM